MTNFELWTAQRKWHQLEHIQSKEKADYSLTYYILPNGQIAKVYSQSGIPRSIYMIALWTHGNDTPED